jgi:hypothetical protein
VVMTDSLFGTVSAMFQTNVLPLSSGSNVSLFSLLLLTDF